MAMPSAPLARSAMRRHPPPLPRAELMAAAAKRKPRSSCAVDGGGSSPYSCRRPHQRARLVELTCNDGVASPMLSPAESLGLAGAALDGRLKHAVHDVSDATLGRVAE